MYLHLGSDIMINTRDIIGIFDIDNTTVSRLGRGFLRAAQKNGIIINAASDLPKSYVVTKRKKDIRVYVSSYSSQILARHSTAIM